MSTRAADLTVLSREALINRILDLQSENNALSRQLRSSKRGSTNIVGRGSVSGSPVVNDVTAESSTAAFSLHHDPSTSLSTAHGHSVRSSLADVPLSPMAARLSAGNAAHVKKAFEISMSVMVIENGSALSVPMAAVLDKTYGREDIREADTPVVGARFLRDTESTPTQRFSVGSSYHRELSSSLNLDEELVTVHDAPLNHHGRRSVPLSQTGRGSPFGGEEEEPLPKAPESPGSKGKAAADALAERAGVTKLNLKSAAFFRRDLSLDTDAILSHQTLRLFNQRFARECNILSPFSSYGNAVYHYVVKTFAVRNGCQHSPDDVEGFGRTLLNLCREVKHLLQGEPRHGDMVSPCYVFGDLHGNFRDLFYFMDNLISFQDLRYTPHRFMFLGDYVDRGEFSVEVVAYLFAMKILAPQKVLLLRGNHEDTLVSGDVGGYGNTSFRAQCHAVFGMALGEELWHRASETFTYLPLTANIDGKIFCTHGGIPRYGGGVDDRMSLLKSVDFPPMESFFQVPDGESPAHERLRLVGMDTCWADPAEDESRLDRWGFGSNPRGSGVILFGSKAVDDFLEHTGFEFIFRAHQEKSDGLKLSKNARVFTIFSTSAYVGHQNGAGVVLVADGKIRLIVKNADVYDEEEEDEPSPETLAKIEQPRRHRV